MKRVVRWFDMHFEESILVFLLAVIACIELVQVVARNIPVIPSLTWAEELCRFAWIATVFLSLPYTIRTSNILRVSALIDALPAMLHNLLNVIVDIVTLAMMALLAWASVAVLGQVIESGETSPAMLWPMWIMYLIVLVGFVMGGLRSLQMAAIHIIHFKERPVTEIEKLQEGDAAEEFVVPATLDLDGQRPITPDSGASLGAALDELEETGSDMPRANEPDADASEPVASDGHASRDEGGDR